MPNERVARLTSGTNDYWFYWESVKAKGNQYLNLASDIFNTLRTVDTSSSITWKVWFRPTLVIFNASDLSISSTSWYTRGSKFGSWRYTTHDSWSPFSFWDRESQRLPSCKYWVGNNPDAIRQSQFLPVTNQLYQPVYFSDVSRDNDPGLDLVYRQFDNAHYCDKLELTPDPRLIFAVQLSGIAYAVAYPERISGVSDFLLMQD